MSGKLEEVEHRLAILESRVRELTSQLARQDKQDQPGHVIVTKKAKMGVMELHAVFYKCPRCEIGRLAPTFTYCPECGAKVEWRLREEA